MVANNKANLAKKIILQVIEENPAEFAGEDKKVKKYHAYLPTL